MAMSNAPFRLASPDGTASEQLKQLLLHDNRAAARGFAFSRDTSEWSRIDGHLVFEFIDQVERGGAGGDGVGMGAAGNGNLETWSPWPGG